MKFDKVGLLNSFRKQIINVLVSKIKIMEVK